MTTLVSIYPDHAEMGHKNEPPAGLVSIYPDHAEMVYKNETPTRCDQRIMQTEIINYKPKEKILVPYYDGISRLKLFTENMLCDINLKEFNNVAIAGGCLSLILSRSYVDFNKYPNSDIDLFVWGPESETTINKLLIQLHRSNNMLVFKRGRIVTILVRYKQRNIQIINSPLNSLQEILEDFDYSISRVAFNGELFLCTQDYLLSLASQTSLMYREIVDLERIAKLLERGISVVFSENTVIRGAKSYTVFDLFNMNIYEEQTVVEKLNKYLTITDESAERCKLLMQGLYAPGYQLVDTAGYQLMNDQKVSELDKNWKKDYTTSLHNKRNTFVAHDASMIKTVNVMNIVNATTGDKLTRTYLSAFGSDILNIKLENVPLKGWTYVADNFLSLKFAVTNTTPFNLELLKKVEVILTKGQSWHRKFKYKKIKGGREITCVTGNTSKYFDRSEYSQSKYYRGKKLVTSDAIYSKHELYKFVGTLVITPYIHFENGSYPHLTNKLVSFNITQKLPRDFIPPEQLIKL
jgi:hypothetical protein